MKKIMWFLIFHFAFIKATNAQIQHLDSLTKVISDSIFNKEETIYNIDEYFGIYDSVQISIIKSYVEIEAKSNRLTWPYWDFAKNEIAAILDKSKDTMPILMPNAIYLLENKYKISSHPISSGCMWQKEFEIHDSFMKIAILDKYGKDFFNKLMNEANELDKNGKGLKKPTLKNNQSLISTFRKKFANSISEAYQKNGEDFTLLILMEFDGNKILSVHWGEFFFGQAQVSNNLNYFELQDQLDYFKQLNIIGPTFKNKPVKAKVYFNLSNERIEFIF